MLDLTARYETEIELVQKTFGEIRSDIGSETNGEDSSCVSASYHQIQGRLDNLKVINFKYIFDISRTVFIIFL